MSRTDRRESLKLALGAALLPLLSSRVLHARVTPAAGESISPPDCAMIYRRRLERGLPGGTSRFVVTRDFEIHFAPAPEGGYVLSGRQVAVSVGAPDNLARYAELEGQRVERGIFPLQLDAAGRITNWPARTADEQVALALEEVRSQFVNSGQEVGILIEALHNATSRMLAILPHDLFAPGEETRVDSRAIALPWGDEGEVTTRFEASRDPQTRLMRQAQRIVTTSLGGEERRNREAWELFAA